MDNDTILALLFEEEQEEEEIMMLLKRREPSSIFQTRTTEGFFASLINGHLRNDEQKFRNFFRLNPDQFDFILSMVRAAIKETATNAVQTPINAKHKLAVTLKFLATGESFVSLGYAFRISHNYVSVIVRETLEALCKRLVSILLPSPSQQYFRKSAEEFNTLWGFPNCCAAIDEKHIKIRCPEKSGSLFWNYKGYFSIVLLGLVDANCKFIAVDVGSYGKEGDSGIFNKSPMGKMITKGDLFPPDEKLPLNDVKMPFVVVGDEAFRLQKHLLKPYTRLAASTDQSKANFNYQLSRARRVSENAFGLLSQIFRVFYTTVNLRSDTCEKLVLASCCLHNLLRDGYLEKRGRPFYELDNEICLNENFTPLSRHGGFSQTIGFEVRDAFKNYFCQSTNQ